MQSRFTKKIDVDICLNGETVLDVEGKVYGLC